MFESYDVNEVEEKILQFWRANKILEKIRERNSSGEKFYFLQGPPYTSGRLHLGHAWNHAAKDIVLRYKRMKSFNVWDRAGYDMHGLPTSRKVMAKFGLKSKEDIKRFGVDRFSEECWNFSVKMAEMMNNDLIRLGITLDFDSAYLPITNEFIDAEWFLVKRAEEEGRLYLGKRTLSWCKSCETALAKHETEYKEVSDRSIFVKFRVRGRENEYLVIWTTTPWTIPFNLAIMVDPDSRYVKAKVGDEYWIIAKPLSNQVIKELADKDFEIVDEFNGRELDGLEYEHFWSKDMPEYERLKATASRVHTVVLSDKYVTMDSGTGLVHCAPGCGPEDYEVGHEYGIPPFNNIDERGIFPDDMGRFSGLAAKRDDDKFIEIMEKDGVIIASTTVKHDYAHCQRCHEPVIFRTTPQWFFRIEDLKDKLLEANEKIRWNPESAKNAFRSWLENLRDNSITKQRYWGTPIPIWRCSCGEYRVFGSLKELEDEAGKLPENIHIPWIDEITVECSRCGEDMHRVPDVLDVWIDAGTTSWSCLYYPARKDLFDKFYPADFILEGKDQIRGWFNLLMIASFIAFNRPAFNRVYMHGFVTDVEGVKMSKSLGNIISPYELIDKYGADVLRYYTTQTNAGDDINFSWDAVKLKGRYLHILWNIHRLLISISDELGINPFALDNDLMKNRLGIEERYILSRSNTAVKRVSSLMEEYRIDETIPIIESLFLDISRDYIQMVREKMSIGSKEEQSVSAYTLAHSIMIVLRLFAPVAPFITEAVFLNLKERFHLKEKSIHMWSWPAVYDDMIDTGLERGVKDAISLVQSILNLREKIKRNLRWPVSEVVVITKDKDTEENLIQMRSIIERLANVRRIEIQDILPQVKVKVKADFSRLGPVFKDKAPSVVARLAVESPDAMISHIEKDGKFVIEIEGEEIEILKEYLQIEHEVEEPYVEGKFNKGYIYLNKSLEDSLIGEGYVREISRRVQNMRKEADLNKSDRIILHLKVSEDLKALLAGKEDELSKRVGTSSIMISEMEPSREHKISGEFKIKEENIKVSFDKE